MDEKKELTTIMECSSSYLLNDKEGNEIEKGDGEAKLDEENLSIISKFSEAFLIHFRDILEISESDYKLNCRLSSKEELIIYNLGYHHEDFLRVFIKLRNQLLLKDMLMDETLRKSGTEAEYVQMNELGKVIQKGKCKPKLYETALIMISDSREPIRIPYSDISEIKAEDFMLTIKTDFNDQFIFSKMGRQFDSFVKTLSELISELSLKAQASLKELLPNANSSIIRKAAKFMKEGKAAKRSDLETVSPDLWVELEKKLKMAGVKAEYDFLKSYAQKDKMCIGLKRGLLGDLTGEYIWFLIPIYSTDSKAFGNAIAIEAISSDGGGKATYFFRIVSRNGYTNMKDLDVFHLKVDDYIKKMNRCMLAINFRREPIYIPKERLEEPQYQKYQIAISKIPELRILIELFIGRVIHSSFEQWKADVTDLLTFNVESTDDEVRWKKGENFEQE